ncbi:MAG: hypothetical protein J6K26_09345 [Lachnospiraceae bacterium]|nr:hypothetical protein [Lachnospiraceae bacterium]
MPATSVGEIGLDLVINKNGFEKQMSGLQKTAAKAGKALAAAFTVKKIVDFSKKCVELGSDLQEVQNVVDVTFPKMTKRVDEFAKSAAASFGLSETMAKKYTGTFGAMAKAFGFSEEQAYSMSTTLTGLAGDIASFYNITQDEAYTKLKSVFSGETETLKDLGVVMTQSALDAYALANGWGKTTSAMSEAEKVALRYAFVQKQLSAAQGDFARTSDSWANQVRILKLQVDSIMATIGQGIINLLTPVIKIINTAISKIATLANSFKAFTELLTGNKSSPGKGIAETAAATEGLGTATEGVGKSAEKAAKKLKGLMGFDKLNNIQIDDSASSGSGSGSSVDFGSLAEGAEEADKAEKKVNPILEKIKNRLKELGDLFKQGFKAGLGDDFEASLQRTKEHLQGIKDSLIDIFTDPRVVDSMNNCLDRMAVAIGKVVGAFFSIGQTIIENLVGGIDKYLEQNSDYIKERLIGIFDATGEIAELIGNFAEKIANIFEVFRGDTAKQCTADIIGIFSNAFLGIVQLGLEFGRDVLNCIIQPITENKDKIKEALENTLKPISTILSTLNTAVKETFDNIFEVYDEKVRPAFEGIADGLSSILSTILDNYNEYVAPVLDRLATKFSEVWESHIQPAINKAIEVFGKLAECVSAVWQNAIVPFVNWIVSTIVPIVAPIFESIGETVLKVFGDIGDTISGVLDILGGLLDFITGIFTGDWERCWSGMENVVSGFKDVISSTLQAIFDTVGGIFKAIVETVLGCFNLIGEHIATTLGNAKDSLNKAADFVSSIFGKIKNTISEKITEAKNTVKAGIDSIKNSFNFKWKLPDIKMPHFEVSGKFSIDPPSAPKFGVKWYAKGGVIKSPTLAMMGENGKKEAVVPLDRNLEWRDAIADKIIEKVGAQGGSGSGLTASEVRAIMMEAVAMFAQMIARLDIKAVFDRREAYKAVKAENDIEKKSTGKGL